MHKLGFIGCGNMGRAMLGGALRSGFVCPEDVIASAKSSHTLAQVADEFKVDVTFDNAEAAKASMVVLAVKPQVLESIALAIAGALQPESVVVSIAAGKSIDWLAGVLGTRKIVRLMPNTPAAIGKGFTSVAYSSEVSPEEKSQVEAFVSSFGSFVEIPERLFDVATATAGSSPAFVYMFIEAMADAAVKCGMPRAAAYEMAAAAVEGSAAMVRQTGQHPGALKDAVCSPGGTTIEGVRVLEQLGFRSAVIEAIDATVQKSRSL